MFTTCFTVFLLAFTIDHGLRDVWSEYATADKIPHHSVEHMNHGDDFARRTKGKRRSLADGPLIR